MNYITQNALLITGAHFTRCSTYNHSCHQNEIKWNPDQH